MSSFDRMQRLGLDPNLTGDALREALENCKREILDQIARQTARADIQRRADALGIPAGALDDLSALANELARKRTDLDAIASWLDQERARIAALPTAGEWVRGLLAQGFTPVSIEVIVPDDWVRQKPALRGNGG